MRELYRLNRDKLDKNYDLWILMKKKFTKADSREIDKIFTDALLKINDK